MSLTENANNRWGRADAQGNTALWNAIAARHHKIFNILYHFAHVSTPHAGGDLLCLAARRGDVEHRNYVNQETPFFVPQEAQQENKRNGGDKQGTYAMIYYCTNRSEG